MTPKPMRPMRVHATGVLIVHICLQSPQARRRRATWSITGKLSTKEFGGYFSNPSHLRWRSPQRSIIDRPEFREYRFNQYRLPTASRGDQETRIHGTGDDDGVARWAFLNRWNGGGLTGDGRLIESEEDGAEVCRLAVRIGLEIRMDVDDKSEADDREQTHLLEQVRYLTRANDE